MEPIYFTAHVIYIDGSSNIREWLTLEEIVNIEDNTEVFRVTILSVQINNIRGNRGGVNNGSKIHRGE